VILGADFLTKTGIDVKYSTCTIQWFENELPLRDPHTLKDKDHMAMAEIVEIQQVDFFGWIGMIQLAMQSKYLMQNMKRFKLMML
jgi:16S rRNA C967 or C1407 C5-methylase (RsmB/RsmF family)